MIIMKETLQIADRLLVNIWKNHSVVDFVLWILLVLKMNIDLVTDYHLFNNLNHQKLAKHVFPDRFEGSGPNVYQARKECISAASVSCLYFHNSHDWRYPTAMLFGAGFVKLEICNEFLSRGVYNNAIKKGRYLIHEE